MIDHHGRSGLLEEEKQSRFSEKQNLIHLSLAPKFRHSSDRATTVYRVRKIEMLLKSDNINGKNTKV
jgi:hypothetical protein